MQFAPLPGDMDLFQLHDYGQREDDEAFRPGWNLLQDPCLCRARYQFTQPVSPRKGAAAVAKCSFQGADRPLVARGDPPSPPPVLVMGRASESTSLHASEK